MTNDERERTVAGDVRSRVIADCAALLPLALGASEQTVRNVTITVREP